mgnify:CR=1 FL=1
MKKVDLLALCLATTIISNSVSPSFITNAKEDVEVTSLCPQDKISVELSDKINESIEESLPVVVWLNEENISTVENLIEEEIGYNFSSIEEQYEYPSQQLIDALGKAANDSPEEYLDLCAMADNVESNNNGIVEDVKQPVILEKCSEQLMNTMQNGADTFEVQIAYTDISKVKLNAEINKKVSEYRTNLESEGLTATEIAEKCSEYRKSLNEELIYTVRLERAEQILADIGVDVDSAECAKKTATINCTLNIDQITKAVENELVYGIALISELPEPEGPGEVVIPMETVIPTETVTTTVLTTDSEDTVTTTTTTAVSQVMISDGVKKAMNEQADVAVHIRYNDNSIAIFDDAKAKAAEYIATLDPNDYDKKLEEIEEEYRNNLYNTNIKAERETRTATILETLNISADEVKCEEKNPVISCVLSSEQLNIAKENELIAEIVLQSEYESVEHFIAGVPSDVTSEDELPQTGYSNIYKVLTGIASAMTIAGATMIARSKKKDEE